MAQLIDIVKVEVGSRTLTATVRVADSGPLMTSEDLEGTTRVYNLMPHIIEHACLGDAGETFKDVMGNTELAHLLEHVTVELLAQSDVAGDVTSGRTRAVGEDGRTYEIELACPDDVLVAGALASACWMLGWAYSGGTGAEPDVAATVEGLVGLVKSLPAPAPVVAGDTTVVGSSRSMLQLVADDAPEDGSPEQTDRLSVVEGPAAVVVPEPVAETPPSESPEARQAAADVPFDGSSQATGAFIPAPSPQAEAPASAAPAEPSVTPMPAPAPASPSATGNLPLSTPIR